MNIGHTKFLDELVANITKLGIDLTGAKLDHLAYYTTSSEDYDNLKPQFEKIAELRKEPIVSGRRVGVFEFKTPLEYKDQQITAIELIEPKPGQIVKESALEHAEFLLPVSLEDFISKYPDVDWDKSNLNRGKFPMLKLKLTETTQVKFPKNPILSDDQRE